MTKIDEAEAIRTLELLQELGELQAELEGMQPETDVAPGS
jgi:hydrogenase maturation factor